MSNQNGAQDRPEGVAEHGPVEERLADLLPSRRLRDEPDHEEDEHRRRDGGDRALVRRCRRSYCLPPGAVVEADRATCERCRQRPRGRRSARHSRSNTGTSVASPSSRGDLVELAGLAQLQEGVVDAFDERVVLLEQQAPVLAGCASIGGNWPTTTPPSISTAAMNSAVGRSTTMASICWVSRACTASALLLKTWTSWSAGSRRRRARGSSCRRRRRAAGPAAPASVVAPTAGESASATIAWVPV